MRIRDISILKNDDNKYAFQIFTRGVIQYTSEYEYDDIFNMENNIESFLKEDYIRLYKNGLYGVFDGWSCAIIIPIIYEYIRQIQHHPTVIFICKLPNNGGYDMRDSVGHKINLTKFKSLLYIGEYMSTNQYLYFFEDDNGVGVLSTEGHVIIPPNSEYLMEHFRHFKQNDYIIIRRKTYLGEDEEETIEDYRFDIFLPDGTLFYENVNNFKFLAI